jgi:hypothetical protein
LTCLQPVFHGLDVVVGDGFDFLDAGGVCSVKSRIFQQGGRAAENGLISETGQRQRLQPGDFYFDAVVHEAGFGQDGRSRSVLPA